MNGASCSSVAQPAQPSQHNQCFFRQCLQRLKTKQCCTACPACTVYNQKLWREAREIAATHDAVQYLAPAIVPSSDDTLREVHRLLQEGHGVNAAAEALSLVTDLAKSCPSTSKKFVKDLLPKMRDVFVLRILGETEPEGYGDRKSFLDAVEELFGKRKQILSRENKDIFLHSHRKISLGTPWAFPTETAKQRRLRRRHFRPTAEDRQVTKEIESAVYDFLCAGLCRLYVHRVLQRLESLCDSDPQIPEEMNSPTPGKPLCPQRSQFRDSNGKAVLDSLLPS